MVQRPVEESRLAAALERARGAEPQVIVIEGELGSGKTWLLDRLAGRAVETRIVELSAREVGGDPNAGVDALLAALGARRRRAGADTAATAAGLLAACAAAAEEHPLLIAIDDAQELDAASADTIWRALRRLRHGRVLVVVASRPQGRMHALLTRGTSGERARVLRLDGLGRAAVARLALERGVEGLRPADAARLTELTDGNPLHLVTAIDGLGPRLRVRVPDSLPVPSAFAEELEVRLAGCGDTGRALLAIAAVAGDAVPLSTVLAISELTGLEVSLDDAMRTGLLDLADDIGQREVRIASARIREGIRHALPDARRRALHAAVAEQFEGERRATHLLAATELTDEAVADELADAAAEAARAGRLALAARHAARAAGVRRDAAARALLLLQAAELATLADEQTLARSLAPALEGLPASPRRELALAGLDFVAGDFDLARRRVRALGEEAGRGSAFRAVVEGGLAWAAGDPDAVLAAAREPDAAPATASPLEAAAESAHEQRRRLLLAGAQWIGGLGDPRPAIGELLHPGDDRPVAMGNAEARIMLGQVALYGGQHRESSAVFAQAVAEARASGSTPVLQLALAMTAFSGYATGDWPGAERDAEEILGLSLTSGESLSDGMAHTVLAMLDAQRGELQSAARRIRAAREHERRRPVPQTTGIITVATALLERGRGDPEGVLLAFEGLEGSAVGATVDAAGAGGWRVLRAEALVRLGREAEARAQLARVPEGASALFGHPQWVLGLAAELRGDAAGAVTAYREAAAASDLAETPWARAVALESLGGALGRAGAGDEAATTLRLARAAAVRLGLAGTTPSTPREGSARPAPAASWSALTPREREVAELAAAGRLNREIADELHVAVKTVEYHLARALAKLGLRSRRQLR
ncbi:LuxR C-terminal-related transcriptional regulator [Homoserinibacter sp. YIM 151385]|uniref:LuxR C-terminal-related transcriptional regulator n=1 Tax=Homoserinibacter sp. YIM 151385 TaxID=2985506 RepID=UPI0022F0F290|nr:LuxR family transcriptional regulator [Homoserinibacter sp. YIM 151385]WBU37749.1 LuxR C-terminal-related transcriptional regulator [Homoserinibacter sp. YIM 151385]